MNKTEDPLVEDKTYRRLQCFRIHVYYSLINAYIYIYISIRDNCNEHAINVNSVCVIYLRVLSQKK